MVKPGFKITGLKCSDCGRCIGPEEDVVAFTDTLVSCLDCKPDIGFVRTSMRWRLSVLNREAKIAAASETH